MYYVYILKCKDKTLYTGITTDVTRRFEEHKSGRGAYYTKWKKVIKIVYSEEQPDRRAALKRESEIKRWTRQKKLILIKGVATEQIERCTWASSDDKLMQAYHDDEWGTPLYADNKIFEFLTLESFQAGLSWRTILNKRRNFERAFMNFNPTKVAKFSKKDFNRLLRDRGIVRNRAKIEAAINNAKRFLEVKKEFGTFSKYM